MAVAYPDSHVKGIKIRYRDKETTAIGLAMPREAALVGMADEILVAGRLFEEGDQPEAILGMQLAKSLGFSSPQGRHRGRDHRRGRRLMSEAAASSLIDHKVLTVTIVGIYRAPPLMPAIRSAGHLSARGVDEGDSRHVSESALNR